MLKGEGLLVSLGGKPVLHSIHIAVAAGRIISIVGPNGSGKSTLLKTLSGTIRPRSGRIYLGGENLSELSSQIIARQVAVLPQTPQAPADLTVKDLVEYGRYPHQRWWKTSTREDHTYVEWALSATRLTGLESRLVNTLSGGERQRVWLAMALAQNPRLLMLDEPTTYLDICHQLEIMELLTELNRKHGITVVMVLHDIGQAARYSHDIIMLKQGKVFAEGSPHGVITPYNLQEVFGVDSHISLDEQGRLMVTIKGLAEKQAKQCGLGQRGGCDCD